MRSHRTTARGLFLIVAFGLSAAAWAAPPAGKPPATIVFPVIGPASYIDDYGDARGRGRHEGNDIMSVRRALAVAAEAGRVEFETSSSRAGCMLSLYGRSGTKYVYVHLNNDSTPRNDNRGGCVSGVAFPRGLKSGQRVSAGQPVGYVGDSGDADGAQPHLHFELHPGGASPTNPYPYLRKAQRLLFHAPPGSMFTLSLTGTVVETDGTDLRIAVEALRWWPNGLRVTDVGRTLTLDVTAAIVEHDPRTPPKALAAAKKGQRVTVFTAPQPATREAQLGKERALLADRIVVRGG